VSLCHEISICQHPWDEVITKTAANISSRAVIQEIVNRPGWVVGNPLALIVTGTGKRVADAFEGHAAGAPLLHLDYR
jgi:hypothetical protein